MNDGDIMPWGKHEGELMGDVPTNYLKWCLENMDCLEDTNSDLYEYIEQRLEDEHR